MSSAVRSILLRALFDPDFGLQLSGDPDNALADYNLSTAEQDALRNPSPALYALLQPPSEEPGLIPAAGPPPPPPPPPPPVTIVTVIVVAIIAFVAAASGGSGTPDLSQFQPLIDGIRSSTGKERFDLVKTLVNELTQER